VRLAGGGGKGPEEWPSNIITSWTRWNEGEWEPPSLKVAFRRGSRCVCLTSAARSSWNHGDRVVACNRAPQRDRRGVDPALRAGAGAFSVRGFAWEASARPFAWEHKKTVEVRLRNAPLRRVPRKRFHREAEISMRCKFLQGTDRGFARVEAAGTLRGIPAAPFRQRPEMGAPGVSRRGRLGVFRFEQVRLSEEFLMRKRRAGRVIKKFPATVPELLDRPRLKSAPDAVAHFAPGALMVVRGQHKNVVSPLALQAVSTSR